MINLKKQLIALYFSLNILRECKPGACYNQQHPSKFTNETIAGLKIAIIEHLDNGLRVSEIGKQNSKSYEGRRRVSKNIGNRYYTNVLHAEDL